MKEPLRIALLLFSLVFIFSFSSFSQNPLECQPGRFWVVDNQNIYQYDRGPSSVTQTGTTISAPGTSIAIADNPVGGSFSPTFIATNSSQQLAYWDGTNWQTLPPIYASIYNNGGHEDDHYIMGADQSTATLHQVLLRYNGSTLDTLLRWVWTTERFTVADIAVDELGRAWVVSGPQSRAGEKVSVVDPTGTIQSTYGINIDTQNAYGSLIDGDTLYIAFGAAHPVHPNTLIPFQLTQDSLLPMTPIPFPGGANWIDLASCSPGNPEKVLTGRGELAALKTIRAFPIPADRELFLEIPVTIQGEIGLNLIDVTGRVVWTQTLESTAYPLKVETAEFKSGVYFLQGTLNGESMVLKKVLVQH